MLDIHSDYARDLDWMLQSGQASPELLLEALLLEFYAPVYRLGLAVLDDHVSAKKAADATFSNALIELHKYRAQDGVETWLYRIALEAILRVQPGLQTRRTIKAWLPFLSEPNDFGDSIPENASESELWLAFDQLDSSTRLSAILRFILNLKPDRIAAILAEPLDTIQIRLEKTRQLMTSEESSQQISSSHERPFSHVEIDTALQRSIQKRCPLVEFSESEMDRLISRSARKAQWLGSRRRGITSLIEVCVVVLIILVGASIAWGMDRLGGAATPTLSPNQEINTVIVTKIVYNQITATPVIISAEMAPVATPFRLQENQFALTRSDEGISALAERLGAPPTDLQTLNRIPEHARFEDGQRVLLPYQWDNLVFRQPAPIQPVEPSLALTEPFLSESIFKRIAVQGPRYNSLWLDAQIIDHGPRSYIGPARIWRAQSWESTDQSLAVIGYPDALPEEAVLRNQREIYLTRPAEDAAWFSEWRNFERYSSLSLEKLSQMGHALFDTHELERGYTFTVLGREEQAGAAALVMDVYDKDGQRVDKLWYDETRGMILRRINYYPDSDMPAFEVAVQAIAYDVNFTQQLFDSRIPWRGGYASDYTGAPAEFETKPLSVNRPPLPEKPLPAGYDLSQSELRFQYPPSYPIKSSSARIHPPPVQIFADSFLLGSVSSGLNSAWGIICDRSPDGNWLAFATRTTDTYIQDLVLQWFNLYTPEESLGTTLSSLGVSEFAFSPDSQQIAYFSRANPTSLGVLGLVNVITRETTTLLSFDDVKSLVWHPDGKSIAMIVRYDPSSYLEHVVVFDLEKSKISYSASIDIESASIQDWPMLDWGVEFPIEMGGMDDCAMPPQP